jgi:hypothetical protein
LDLNNPANPPSTLYNHTTPLLACAADFSNQILYLADKYSIFKIVIGVWNANLQEFTQEQVQEGSATVDLDHRRVYFGLEYGLVIR